MGTVDGKQALGVNAKNNKLRVVFLSSLSTRQKMACPVAVTGLSPKQTGEALELGQRCLSTPGDGMFVLTPRRREWTFVLNFRILKETNVINLTFTY